MIASHLTPLAAALPTLSTAHPCLCLLLTIPGGTEAVGISFWDQKENAEAYHREIYPEVQKLLAKVIEGTPQVQTYEVSRSTIHKVTARATA